MQVQPQSTSTRGQRFERMPFPVAALWAGALRSGQVSEVQRAFENLLRLATSLVLSDALDLPWSEPLQDLLGGGPDRRAPSRLSFGQRALLLKLLVEAHSAATPDAPPRVLPPLDAWWETFEPLLEAAVTERNQDAHAVARRDHLASAQLDRLALALRSARWLQEVQLVVVDAASQRLGVTRGRVSRLVGPAPFDDLRHQFDATWRGPFSSGLVHIGRHDASCWLVSPFLHVEPPGLLLLDGVSKSGALVCANPLALDLAGPSATVLKRVPTADGDLDWFSFLRRRLELSPSLRFTEGQPHDLLRLPPPPTHALVPDAMLDADHRLLRRLGEGGMAQVWEAEDVHSRARFALKIPRPDLADAELEARFRREIELLKRLHADGVRRIVGPVERLAVDLGEERWVVLKMPLYPETLADRLRAALSRGAPLPEADVLRWGRQALEALSDLHARGVVHRDVKPSNLLLDARGDLFLADFGIARDTRNDVRLTRTLSRMGSEHYMAPEQLHSTKGATSKADVHALAASLHELATGATSPTPGKGLDGLLGVWLPRMTRLDPDERPSASEVLSAWSGGSVAAAPALAAPPAPPSPVAPTPTAPPPSPGSPPPSPPPRARPLRRRLLATSALAASALLVWLAVRLLTPPACGDGRVDPGEDCDDGNTDHGDLCSPGCASNVAVLPGGVFQMGFTEEDFTSGRLLRLPSRNPKSGEQHARNATPATPVDVPAYRLMRTEVSRAAFRRFALGDTPPAPSTYIAPIWEATHSWAVAARATLGTADELAAWHAELVASVRAEAAPIVARLPEDPVDGRLPAEVPLRWAVAFCAWLGGAIPTEAQFEYAARAAGDGRTFPWGEDLVTPDPRHCRRLTGYFNIDTARGERFDCGGRKPTPVDHTVDGCTPQGICDLSGNSDEFVHPGPVRWSLEPHPSTGREVWVARLPGPIGPTKGAVRSCEHLSARDPFGLRSGYLSDCAIAANQETQVRETSVPRDRAMLVVRGGNFDDSQPVLYQTRARYPFVDLDYARGFRCAFGRQFEPSEGASDG
jgi:cysteine-rich repeat protein